MASPIYSVVFNFARHSSRVSNLKYDSFFFRLSSSSLVASGYFLRSLFSNKSMLFCGVKSISARILSIYFFPTSGVIAQLLSLLNLAMSSSNLFLLVVIKWSFPKVGLPRDNFSDFIFYISINSLFYNILINFIYTFRII